MNSRTSVNIYDFDHTIYDGDVSFDFIAYCMLRYPRTWKYIPAQGITAMKYVFGLASRKQTKQVAFSFLRSFPNAQDVVQMFWSTRQHKIKRWYLNQKRPTDLVISASPEFLLEPITQLLGIQPPLATIMDIRTGRIIGANCRAEEKVRRLAEYDPSLLIDNCYSDHLSDLPLLRLAKSPYIVKKHTVYPLADYTLPKLSRFKDPAFIRFLFVGGINAFCGVLFAYIISFFMADALVAWIFGYVLSLFVSYPLNAVVTFRHASFSLKQFGSFCVSYIPNFIVQLIVVHLLINQLGLYRVFAYVLAVIVAVPVTFFLLRQNTFKTGQ